MFIISLIFFSGLLYFNARELKKQDEIQYLKIFEISPNAWALWSLFLTPFALAVYLYRRFKFQKSAGRPSLIAQATGILLVWIFWTGIFSFVLFGLDLLKNLICLLHCVFHVYVRDLNYLSLMSPCPVAPAFFLSPYALFPISNLSISCMSPSSCRISRGHENVRFSGRPILRVERIPLSRCMPKACQQSLLCAVG